MNSLSTHSSLSSCGRRPQWWMLMLLAFAAIAVYANSLRNEFAFDDVGVISDNAMVQDLEWSSIWSSNYWPIRDGASPDKLYRPLTIWTYLANQSLTPNAPWTFHLTNVLLHALTTVLVTLLAWRLAGDRRIAAVTGLLFALHPLHTEVVANTVGRAEMLGAIWSLLALLIYLPEEPLLLEQGPKRRFAGHGILVAACFFLAMLSKETPVTLIGAFVLIDAWRWSRWDVTTRPSLVRWFGSQTLRYYVPVLMAFGVYMAMRIHGTGLMQDTMQIHPLVNPLVMASMPERLVTPFLIFSRYLSLTVWPAVMSADYSAPSLMPTSNLLSPGVLIGLLTTLLGAVVAVRWWKHSPVPLVIGLFFVSYAIVSNFLRIGTIMGDRLFYIPSIFVFMLLAWGIVTLWGSGLLEGRRVGRAALVLVVAVACVAMSVRTVIRNTDWHDNITLAIATARDNTNSAKACYWAGSILTTQGPEPWMVEFGVKLLKQARELYPDFGDSAWELAKYYGRKGELVPSTIYLAEAAWHHPASSDIRRAINEVSADLKQHPLETYFPGIKKNLLDHMSDPPAHLAMALALRAKGKLPEAVGECGSALHFDPYFHEAASFMAMIQLEQGQTEAAVSMLKKYVATLPSSFDAKCFLAEALMDLDAHKHPEAFAEAAEQLDHAAALYPNTPQIRILRKQLKQKIAAAEHPVATSAPHEPAPSLAQLPRSGETR